MKWFNDQFDEVGESAATILNGLDKSRFFNELVKYSWLLEDISNEYCFIERFENKQGIDVVHGESNRKENRSFQTKTNKVTYTFEVFLRIEFDDIYRLVDYSNIRLRINSTIDRKKRMNHFHSSS